MTNSIEKAERAMKRREIFDRLSVGAEERMTPILSEAIDEIASRDAEVAELKSIVAMLRKAHKSICTITNKQYGPDWEEIDDARFISNEVLVATEHHDRS